MSESPKSTARAVASKVLGKFNPQKHDAASLLASQINRTDQRGQATDLVFGTIRNRSLIDFILANVIDTPAERINKRMLNIVRVGVYELVFATQTADYAIVSEAVNLATEAASKKQGGFVNAVLRNIIRSIDQRSTGLASAILTRTVPLSPTDGCLFTTDFLPDPNANPADYFSTAFSIPKWLIETWLEAYGVEKTRQICFSSNRRPSVCLQANTLKTSSQELTEIFNAGDIDSQTFDNGTIKLTAQGAVNKLPGFEDGLFMIQDPTAAKVARLLDPAPGQTIVDFCAAPGGKTVALAQLMNNTGTIIATDIQDKRLDMVTQNCQRLGITNVQTVTYNEFDDCLASTPHIDAVLLDVPCSNSGVLARRLEVRMRITPEAVKELTKTQLAILQKAASVITPGAKICYSTCSICPHENENMVKNFLQNNADFTLLLEELTLPTPISLNDDGSVTNIDHDGGYVAILQKV